MLSYAKKYRSVLWMLAFVPLTSCSMEYPWTNKEPQPLAQPLPVDDKPKRLAIGDTTVVGVKADGTVWSWGNGSHGALGDGQAYSRQATPTQLPNMTNFVEVATGGQHYLALRKDGTVWSWGDNECGQLGYETEPELTGWDKKPSGNTYSTIPKQIKELKEVISVAAGMGHSVALTKSGDVFTFGCNDGGQLGLGYADDNKPNKKLRHIEPIKIGNVPDGVKVNIGSSSFIILTNNKEVWLAGHLVLRDNQTNYTIKLTKIYLNFFLSKLLVDYNGMILLREDGLLYQASFDKYISNKIYLNIDIILNRGKPVLNIGKSMQGFLALDSDEYVYHIYQGTKWTTPHIKNTLEIYSSGGVFAAFTPDGKVYFWGDYSHGVRGLGNPHDLGTRYLSLGTRRFKKPEVSLWTWK